MICHSKIMASINRHAIEISSNTRTQRSATLPSSSLRGNPSNLGLPLPRVKSLRCDPRRDPSSKNLPPQVTIRNASSTMGRSAVPISWARGRTLRVSRAPRQARTALFEVASTTSSAPCAQRVPAGHSRHDIGPGQRLMSGELRMCGPGPCGGRRCLR